MKKIILLFLFAVAMQFNTVWAGNINMPDKYVVKEQSLVLNGSGIRHKWVDLYSAGLYLKSRTQDASKVINNDEPMNIKINVISKLITSSRLEEAMRSEINRVTDGNIASYKDRIEQLAGTFKGEIKQGDIFDLAYVPGNGLLIYKNKQLQTTINGLDFKKVIFSTWLGNDPADESLKDGMMGNKK